MKILFCHYCLLLLKPRIVPAALCVLVRPPYVLHRYSLRAHPMGLLQKQELNPPPLISAIAVVDYTCQKAMCLALAWSL